MITVALFDLDDTLFAHREAVQAGIRAHARALGYPGEPVRNGRLWYELEEHHYHRYLAGEIGFEQQRRARATDFAAANGVWLDDEEAGHWFAEYFDRYVESWHLHTDALPVLDALSSRGVRLGVITNGELDFQLRKIRGVGLSPRLEHVVASGDVGVVKPDPRIFEIACERFGVAPHEALYVGDRLATDAIGAARAGLMGVFLDRVGAPGHGVLVPDDVVRITSLAELPGLLVS
ncbi:HAD family hydrolase [Microbacteriaceae bacterium VKM Ac-2855]|nr:HAD family hydrolase [Microbacteriaceae bacterium VKM Ac-2855]